MLPQGDAPTQGDPKVIGTKRVRKRRRHRVLVLVVVLAALATGCAATEFSAGDAGEPLVAVQQPGSGDLLPDLATLPVDTVYVEPRDGRRFLRLSNEVANRGPGPFELSLRADDCDGDGDRSNDRSAYQRIPHDRDGDGRFQRGDDEAFRLRAAGCMVYHPDHQHWHFDAFARFDLVDAASGRVVGSSRKVSFCLVDMRQLQPQPPGAAGEGHYQGCGTDRQGLSPGWVDRYGAGVGGQEIDVTGLRDGRYRLVSTVDPDNRVVESDELNNRAVLVVDLQGTRVTALGEPSALSGFRTLAGGLHDPQAIAVLPDGRALVVERTGGVRVVTRHKRPQVRSLVQVELDAPVAGQDPLLGIAIDPRFERNGLVYLSQTTGRQGSVVRYRLRGRRLRRQATILEGKAVGPAHNGGRLGFGPDGRLYVATGDATLPHLAQDTASLNGKLLRLEPRQYRGSGGRPEIFSLGHRAPRGLDWQPGSGRLAVVEQGSDGQDELNLVRRGGNYGWPELRGRHTQPGFAAATAVLENLAPSDATFVPVGSAWAGDLLVATDDGRIVRIGLAGPRIAEVETLLHGELGPLRAIQATSAALHILTGQGQVVVARLPT